MSINLKKFFDRLPKFLRRRKIARFLLHLSPGSKIQLVEFNQNARLYADISDSFPLSYFLTRSYAQDFLRIASVFLSSGGTYFDVGANFGFCSFGILGILKNIPVSYYLFEANPEMVQCLHRSAALYPNARIKIFGGAVTQSRGRSKLLTIPSHLGSSYLSNTGGLDVENLVLDEIIQKEGIQQIDFMKLDIEGSEPAALQGCSHALASGMVKVLYFEVTKETLSRFNWTVESFLSLIKGYGFTLFFVLPLDFNRLPEILADARTITINGQTLRVSPVNRYPDYLETDLLAIHESLTIK